MFTARYGLTADITRIFLVLKRVKIVLLADPMFLQQHDVRSLEQLPTKYLLQYVHSVTVILVGLIAVVFNWDKTYLTY